MDAEFDLMHALIEPLHTGTYAQLAPEMPGLFGRRTSR